MKKISYFKFLFLIASTLFLAISCKKSNEKAYSKEDILWYSEPAKSWNQAMPLGNGRLGVMVFGNTSNEHIQLNDDAMWPSDLGWDDPSGTKKDLEHIRELLFKGENTEADRLFVEKFSRKEVIRSHQTMGDLFMDFQHQNITDYKRELNISNATATISYKSNGDLITEKVLVSKPHQLILVEFSSEAKEGLNGKIRLSRPKDEGVPTVKVTTNEDNHLIMLGEVTQRSGKFDSKPAPITAGVKFETRLKIKNEGGEIRRGNDYLELKNVKKATFYLVSNSSFYHADFSKKTKKDLANAEKTPISTIKKQHIDDYKALYNRTEIQLTENPLDSLTITKRLALVKQGKTDLGLESLLFQYGRYLLISSSREGTNPANLQGLWNNDIVAPWNGDYHLNINLQMNYWPANLTGLDELNMPLFDFIDKLVENGKITAQKSYGCEGAFIPHATDLWAETWLRAPTAYWGCSLAGGGWLMQHYWQHYEFTRDKTFLKNRAFPAIQEVTKFYSDWLIRDPRDGKLISAPSTSPENRYINANGKSVSTCLGSAMDQQVIDEVFTNYIKACKVLGVASDFLEKVKQQQQELRPGFVIGDTGRVLEWDREYEETEPGHRHMSHLYGFHPGVSVTKSKTPKMLDAVKKTLDFRLENGGAGPGWSRAWLINCSARLFDGEMAHKHIKILLQKSIYDNLLNVHPPYQIDGNFGYTASVVELLLQSHEEGILRILPALPSEWKQGHVKGLKARGGLTVDIYWKNNQLEKLNIISKFDTKTSLSYKEEMIPVELKSGKPFVFTPKASK